MAMKKLSALLFFAFNFFLVNAQNISLTEDTVWISGSASEFEWDGETYLTTTDALPNDSMEFNWTRIEDNLQANWVTLVCDENNCYSTTVSTNNFFLHPSVPALLKLGVRPYSTGGNGLAHIHTQAIQYPQFDYTVTFLIAVWPLSVVETKNDIKVSVFPNPVIDDFEISSNQNFSGITIFNLMGQKILDSEFAPSNHYSTSLLPYSNGIYFFNLFSADGSLLFSGKLDYQ